MKAPTQQVELLLQQMKKEHGTLTPEDVIRHARDPASVLHEYFTWDPEKALEKNLLNEARTLIRSVKIEITIEEHTIRAPKYLKDLRQGNNAGYDDVVSIRKDVDRSRETFILELERVLSSIERAKRVAAALHLSVDLTRPAADINALLISFREELKAAAE